MAKAFRRGYGNRKADALSRPRAQATDYQRANALLWLAHDGEAVVQSDDIERILRTVPSSRVVLTRHTKDGAPVYRVTAAGQRWALEQLSSSMAHSGRSEPLRTAPKIPEPAIESRRVGRATEWRAIDYARRIRTEWLESALRNEILERAAKTAVRRTDPSRLGKYHSREDGWVVVHAI